MILSTQSTAKGASKLEFSDTTCVDSRCTLSTKRGYINREGAGVYLGVEGGDGTLDQLVTITQVHRLRYGPQDLDRFLLRCQEGVGYERWVDTCESARELCWSHKHKEYGAHTSIQQFFRSRQESTGQHNDRCRAISCLYILCLTDVADLSVSHPVQT